MSIYLIGMPIYYGCDVKGTDLVYEYLSKRNIKEKFKKHKLIDKGNILVDEYANKYDDESKIKYIKPIMDSNKLLYKSVIKNLNDGVSLVIGGDHSSVIGSICAELDYYNGDVTVIWIDTHTDIHTDKTTPSGNIHGMPVSILMGLCNGMFNIGNNKLKSENLIYIGINSYEKEEIDLISSKNIKNYKYNDIVEKGLENILNEIIKSIKTKYVHLSFDCDCLDYKEFKAVNVAYSKKYISTKGLKIEEGKYILNKLLNNLNICGLDIVEYNPLMDNCNDIKVLEDILILIDENLK